MLLSWQKLPTASACHEVRSRSSAASAAGRSERCVRWLASAKAACRTAKPVTIWKVRSGADRKVGTAVTRSDGTYRLPKARRLGRYYAITPMVAVTDVAQCSAATSAVFRIR